MEAWIKKKTLHSFEGSYNFFLFNGRYNIFEDFTSFVVIIELPVSPNGTALDFNVGNSNKKRGYPMCNTLIRFYDLQHEEL